jgi:hypothetical protein
MNPDPSLTQQTALEGVTNTIDRLRYRPRRRSPAPGPFFSIRILINWRRKDLAIDASADARADRSWRAVRQDIRLRLTGIANDKGSMDMPMVLLGCLGHGWCNRH